MQNVFFFETLHQAVGDQLVVFRRAQVLGDVLEGEQETLEVFVAVECIDFGLGGAFSVTLAEFEQRGRFDCALKVQVQLGLRQKAEKTARRPIECGGHDSLIVDSCWKICEAKRINHGNTEFRREHGNASFDWAVRRTARSC